MSLFGAWGRWVVRRHLAAGLDGVHLDGLERVEALARREPLVLASTHVSWWDGLIAVALAERLGVELRIPMRADRLAELPFFASFGAFPLRAGAAARHDLRSLAEWLDRPGRAVWIFPQGHQRPAHLRPLGLRGGFARVARSAGVGVVPVALDYRFREDPRPAAVVRFLPILRGERVSTEALERALVEGLEGLDDAVPPAPPARVDGSARALGWLWRTLNRRTA